MAYLVLLRHGLSEYNKKGIWTGWIDPDLAPEGEEQARRAGEVLKDITFDYTYSNILRRCIKTLEIVKHEIGQEKLPTLKAWQLLERNYGDYTLKNKWEVQKQIGEEAFQALRRGWDYPVPNGESLKQVFDRELPYYQEEIEPKLKAGKNVLIASSGNSLRALVKYLENIPENNVGELEIGTGEVYIYTIDEQGKVTHKEIRSSNPNKGKV